MGWGIAQGDPLAITGKVTRKRFQGAAYPECCIHGISTFSNDKILIGPKQGIVGKGEGHAGGKIPSREIHFVRSRVVDLNELDKVIPVDGIVVNLIDNYVSSLQIPRNIQHGQQPHKDSHQYIELPHQHLYRNRSIGTNAVPVAGFVRIQLP